MTNVAATNSTSSTLSTSGTTATNPADNMGQNQFLMLMMDQLKAQDPLQPSDPTQYLSELAGFSSLQEQTSIASSTSAAATQQASSSALGLLGHTVTYTDANGAGQTGTVTKVDFTSNGPSLTVGSVGGISLTSITEAQ
ncbi:MAG: flagellar hook capping FlgD N-terminal domain-containing protein [Solirubrobacteraceae bacterium]|jgi:flagellar basal-body rod modification protein FlgD